MEQSVDSNAGTSDESSGTVIQSSIIDNLPGMVYRCRLNGDREMLYLSRNCLDLTGYAAHQLTGACQISYWELVHPRDRDDLKKEIQQAVANQRVYRSVYRIVTAQGEERWVLDVGKAIPGPDGSLSMLEGFVSDSTEHREVFRLLERRAVERLRKLDALYDILEVAADSSGLETTIERTLQRVLTAIDGKAGCIHLLEPTGERLELAAHHGLPDETASKLTSITVAQDQLTRWIMEHNQPLMIANMKQDPRTQPLAWSPTALTYIGVPVAANERVLGVLTVFTGVQAQLKASEASDLLVSVGEQVGMVVDNAQLRQRAEQLMVMEERNRLARELHDSVTQSLYGVTLFAEAGKNLAGIGEFEQACQLFDELLGTGSQALKEMRLLVHKLRPPLLEQAGLLRALQQRLNAVEERAGVNAELLVEEPVDLSQDLEETLYHIAQEALNNALKHAAAAEVKVRLRQLAGGEVELEVIDDGKGFDLEAAAGGGGLGLISIRERAGKLNGRVEFVTSPGRGTIVRATFPYLS